MRLFVLYDNEGKIISSMKVNVRPDELGHAYGHLGEWESVLEIKSTSELDKLECHEICEKYVVDLKKKKLKSKT